MQPAYLLLGRLGLATLFVLTSLASHRAAAKAGAL
jgi:hypothetical protein